MESFAARFFLDGWRLQLLEPPMTPYHQHGEPALSRDKVWADRVEFAERVAWTGILVGAVAAVALSVQRGATWSHIFVGALYALMVAAVGCLVGGLLSLIVVVLLGLGGRTFSFISRIKQGGFVGATVGAMGAVFGAIWGQFQ